ncbi:response regulator transcription factor [uncultured Desulfuromonas sp.]|uniref:response regulator transcription factor n=1 Tax=uncultured Desulfuromonas sp. TaxID=181013 RepID=UPI002AAAC700|nr:response regulator transcription factor [uncultured Desulfuromonas sp.]
MMLQKPIKLLLVENDTDLRENVVEFFELSGYQVTAAINAEDFYLAVTKDSYQVAVIDIGLPDQSGLKLTNYLRRMDPNVGIIILTANDADNIKVKGYKAGADNYLVKPASGPLLESAIESLLVRMQQVVPVAAMGERTFPKGDTPCWHLNVRRWVLVPPCGTEIQLTARELKFLTCLADAEGGTVTRHHFLGMLYPTADDYSGRAMDAMVRRLRKKITDTVPQSEQPIKTVYGSGYCFPQLYIY